MLGLGLSKSIFTLRSSPDDVTIDVRTFLDKLRTVNFGPTLASTKERIEILVKSKSSECALAVKFLFGKTYFSQQEKSC